MSELENLLGAAEKAERGSRRRPREREPKRAFRGAPAAIIEGDSHQTFIVEGDLTIVIGEKERAEG